jgi:hypothetical protein
MRKLFKLGMILLSQSAYNLTDNWWAYFGGLLSFRSSSVEVTPYKVGSVRDSMKPEHLTQEQNDASMSL